MLLLLKDYPNSHPPCFIARMYSSAIRTACHSWLNMSLLCVQEYHKGLSELESQLDEMEGLGLLLASGCVSDDKEVILQRTKDLRWLQCICTYYDASRMHEAWVQISPVCRTSYVYSLLMRDNKLKSATVQRSRLVMLRCAVPLFSV